MSKLLEKILKRCENQGLKTRVYSPSPETIESASLTKKAKGVVIQIPEQRDFKNIIVFDTIDELKELSKSKFEKFRFIKSYEAIWSQELKIIECEIQVDNEIRSPFMIKRRLQLLFGTVNKEEDGEHDENPRSYEFPSPNSELKIYFGDSSLDFSILSNFKRNLFIFSNRIRKIPTIRIEGLNVTTHEEAKEALVKIGNSVLFQIDLATNASIHLALDRDILRDFRIRKLKESTPKLTPPKFEYDHEPMALYWYARSARNMPLLQYLAFYQILEFYFPQYSYKDAQQKIKNLLKDPTFNTNRDTDIAQILNVIHVSSKGKTFGDEKSQLKATIQNCVDNQQLWDFFHESSERIDFFDIQSKSKSLVKQKFSFTNKENDLRIEAANRIYELRCRIVHTKDEDELDLILPTSSEISLIKYDLELVEYIARRVLIAGGRQLVV